MGRKEEGGKAERGFSQARTSKRQPSKNTFLRTVGFSFSAAGSPTSQRRISEATSHGLEKPPRLSMSVGNMVPLGVCIISDSGLGADTALYTGGGGGVCRSSHDPMCQGPSKPPPHLPALLTHCLRRALHRVVNEVPLEPACGDIVSGPSPTSASHPQLISVNEDKQCARVPANNDWCRASPLPMGNMVWKKFQIKRIPSRGSLVLTPDPHSLGPWFSWERGGERAQRTTAINNSPTRYSAQ